MFGSKGTVNNEDFAVDELWINFRTKVKGIANHLKTLDLFRRKYSRE